MLFSRRRLWAVMLAVFPIFAGCSQQQGSNSGSGKTKVAIVTNCTAEFWSIAEAGANKAAKDFDVEVIFRQPANQTVSDQTDIVIDVVKLGITGIAVSVIKPDDQAASLKAIGKKVHLITMDNDSAKSERLCYIGVDNYEAGKAVGRMIQKAKPDGGTVAVFIGSVSSANAKERIGGVLDQLAGAKGASWDPGKMVGKYKLEGIYTDDAVESVAQDRAKDVLEKNQGTPNFIAVGLYAYNPKAILQAAKAKGMVGKISIAAFDEDQTTLKGIQDGEILGTIVQDPFGYAYKSVEILAALAKGDKSKAKDVAVPYKVLTKDGGPEEKINDFTVVNLKVADFKAQLQANLDSVKK
ncbi:MAG: substrate-binding domain-containing protein [Fimbriiglobus sp.]